MKHVTLMLDLMLLMCNITGRKSFRVVILILALYGSVYCKLFRASCQAEAHCMPQNNLMYDLEDHFVGSALAVTKPSSCRLQLHALPMA